jgi:TonB family protein
MFRTLISLIIFSSNYLIAQSDSAVTYYDNGNIKSVVQLKNNVLDGEARFYWENGRIKEDLNYVNGRVDGLVRRYNGNGKLQEMFTIENGKREGPTSLFDSSGNYVNDVYYENGILVVDKIVLDSGEHFREIKRKESTENKTPVVQKKKKKNNDNNLPPVIEEESNYEDDPAFYQTVEIMPEPIGGMNAIYKKIIYPEDAKENNIGGIVKILTFIDRDGEVLDAQVIEGIGHGCDEAARLAVFYHRFKPGMIKGQKVKVQMEIPVEFKLPPKE